MKKLLAVLLCLGLVGYAYASSPTTPQQDEADQLHALQDDYNQRQAQATAEYIKQHDQEQPDREEVAAPSQPTEDDRLIKVANNNVLVSNETKAQ